MLKYLKSYKIQILLYIMAAGIFTMLLVAAGMLYFTNYFINETVHEMAWQNSEKLMVNLDNTVLTYQNILFELANDQAVQNLAVSKDGPGDVYSKMYLMSSGFENDVQFSILAADGTMRVSVGRHGNIRQEKTSLEWGILRKVVQTRDDVIMSEDKNSYSGASGVIFTLAHPIIKNEQLLGFVLADVYRSALIRLVHGVPDFNLKNILVTDHYNYVVYNNIYGGDEGFHRKDYVEQCLGESGNFSLQNEQNERVFYNRSPVTGFCIVELVAPDTTYFSMLKNALVLALLLAIILLALFVPSMTRSLWQPIGTLSEAMKSVRHNDFTVRVQLERSDEIGELAHTFNRMVQHIQDLIHNIEEKNKTLRIAQVKYLYAQIKPHFIYNTLDLIKWSAKLNDMDSVVDLTVNLGKLLRKTISGVGEYSRVQDELELIQAYLNIQQRHLEHRLDVELKVETGIMSYYLPKLILQPIVENALNHGLDNKKKDGRLIITGQLDDQYLRFVVEDNGCGMEPEKLKELLQTKEISINDSHVGINNVNLRAKLNGDNNCGVFVESRLGSGTQVTVVVQALKEAPEV